MIFTVTPKKLGFAWAGFVAFFNMVTNTQFGWMEMFYSFAITLFTLIWGMKTLIFWMEGKKPKNFIPFVFILIGVFLITNTITQFMQSAYILRPETFLLLNGVVCLASIIVFLGYIDEMWNSLMANNKASES